MFATCMRRGQALVGLNGHCLTNVEKNNPKLRRKWFNLQPADISQSWKAKQPPEQPLMAKSHVRKKIRRGTDQNQSMPDGATATKTDFQSAVFLGRSAAVLVQFAVAVLMAVRFVLSCIL